MNFCNNGGFLVGAGSWLPTEPHDVFRASYGIRGIGCNHVVCSRCKQPVRHALGYWNVPRVDVATLFAAPQWSDLEGAQPSATKTGRLYVCACEAFVATADTHLDTTSESDPDTVPLWRCEGHPRFVPPGVIAGVAIELSRGWSPIVAAHLEASGNVHPSLDGLPGFTLTRIYQALESSADQQGLALAVASHADDSSLRARQAVALFFVLNRDAAGFERVLGAWRAEPARYDDHPAAWGRDELLKSTLLETIATRVRLKAPGAEAALATWRWAALRGSGLGVYLHRAALIDTEWTEEHVEQLMDLAPADWEAVVISIHVEFPMRLVPGCRRAIAEGYATREKVVAALTEQYGAKAGPTIAAL